MERWLKTLAVVHVFVATSFVAATPSVGGTHARRGTLPIVEIDGDLAAIGGTSRGTVVLVYGVPPGAATAVRRREIGLDGATLSDVITDLPPGFAWQGRSPFDQSDWATTSIDDDGKAALASATEVRFLNTDGSFSTPLVPTNPPWRVLLRDGFLHLVEFVAPSQFRSSFVWEGFRGDGTRVGPSALLDPDATVRSSVDDQAPDTTSPKRIFAAVQSLDGRPDGSATVVVETWLVPNPNDYWTSTFWLYAIDADGRIRGVPGPGPSDIGDNGYSSVSSRAHAGPDGTTWEINDIIFRSDVTGASGPYTMVAADGSAQLGAVGAQRFGGYRNGGIGTGLRTCSGTTADGRLIVLGTGWNNLVVWASFRAAVAGKPPKMRTRTFTEFGPARKLRRFDGREGFAAVAPDGGSVIVSPASVAPPAVPLGSYTADRLLAAVIGPRGHVVRRVEVPTQDYGTSLIDPRAVACGDLGFAVAWRTHNGDSTPGGSTPMIKLVLLPRR